MRFAFSDDQLSFRDAGRDLLTKLSGPDALRAVWDGHRGFDSPARDHLGTFLQRCIEKLAEPRFCVL